jgi:flavodoxin
MTSLIVYDSVYGNTEKVAKAIGAALPGEVKVVRVGQVDGATYGGADLLVVGSPTLGGRPTEGISEMLNRIPGNTLKGLRVASFDTRYSGRFVKVFGFAADRIAGALTAKGAVMALPPEPFYVMGKKGPLKEGELERAAQWAKGLLK